MNKQAAYMKSFVSLFKPIFWLSIFCLGLILFSSPSYALKVQDVPNPRQEYGGWVTDMAQMLTPQSENQLNQMITELEAKNGTEIAVVTVPDTRPYATPKQFTTELFNTWGIGKKGEDNGVLFLVSKGDRRVEIETGYGIEPILPDAKVGNIIENKIIPRFKQGDFEGGILAGTQTLVNNITAYYDLFPSPSGDRPWFSYIPTYIWFMGNLGLVWSLVSFAWLQRLSKRPLLLKPNEIVERSSGDAETEFYQLQRQNETPVRRYGWIFELSLSLIVVAVAYLVFWGLSAIGLSANGKPTGTILLTIALVIGVIFFLVINLSSSFRRKKVKKVKVACKDCRTRMEKLTAEEVKPYLERPQQVAQVAQELGTVEFIAWKCPKCEPYLSFPGIHLRSYFTKKSGFENCPTCQELTVVRTEKILQPETWNQEGKKLIHKQCQCCNYATENKKIIPVKPLPENTILIPPVLGRKRRALGELNCAVHCKRCHYPMESVSLNQLRSLLNETEIVAQKIGSMEFLGWHCSHCGQLIKDCYICVYVSQSSKYKECPTCQELTVLVTKKVVSAATYDREGKEAIEEKCQYCKYSKTTYKSIPRKQRPYRSSSSSSRSSSSGWGSSSSGSSSSSSWGGSSSSGGGGSDFGGGSSGGGGAGGDW